MDKDAMKAELARKEGELATLQTEISRLKKSLGTAPVSPFAPERFPEIAPVGGVRLAAGAAGVRYAGRTDVMLAEIAPGATIAGTFTRSATRAGPVLWCEELIAAQDGPVDGPVGIVVNSGNANAFTGGRGIEAVEHVVEAAAGALGTARDRVYMASTGVIGEPLPHDRITAMLGTLASDLDPAAWEDAARAIMTTDTFPKGASTTVEIDGRPVTISGFAKGSGMIAPDMGTMLVFIFTDAAVAQPLLQAELSRLTDRTFNAITVDSDTSTSDTLLLAATGASGIAPIAGDLDPRLPAFRDALGHVMHDLALQVVADGEGASKLVAITIEGAESDTAARRVGLAIANSPLVKTAIAGEDPNWGRIVMAIGKAGEKADRDRISIRFGDILVAENGWVSPYYREEDGAAYMKADRLEVTVGLGIGTGRATVWTCDLTHRYIEINADYRS